VKIAEDNMSKSRSALGILTEHQEQSNFFSEVRTRFASRDDFLPELFFSVPNGSWFGGNRFAMYHRMVAEGFRKGVADTLYLQARGKYAYLAIEFKRSDKKKSPNGGLEPEQEIFLERVHQGGGFGTVCYSSQEAVEVFSWYMGLELGDVSKPVGKPVQTLGGDTQ
jgi:hypothetical protein